MSEKKPDPIFRRIPTQERSRKVVACILEGGEEILSNEGAEAFTTKRVAERAGVSVGSLYQYFRDKGSILHAIFEERAFAELGAGSTWAAELGESSAREFFEACIDRAVAYHRRNLDAHEDFYRANFRSYTVVSAENELAYQWLVAHFRRSGEGALRVPPEQAAFLVSRGIGGLLGAAIEHDPELLRNPDWVADLRRMITDHVLGD